MGVVAKAAGLRDLEIDADFLVFDGETIYLFAGSAAEIWRTLDGSTSIDQVTTVLSVRHPAAPSISQEVRQFVSELIDIGLVEERAEPAHSGISVPKHVAWTADGDLVVLADLRTGARHSLAHTAATVWGLLVAGLDGESLIYRVAEQFPDAPESFARDVDEL